MTEIEARSEFCFSVKSRVPLPENEDQEAHTVAISEVICTAHLPPATGIQNFQLDAETQG